MQMVSYAPGSSLRQYYTGDQRLIGEEGYFYFVGRRDDVLQGLRRDPSFLC